MSIRRQRFAVLRRSRRVWAVAAVHGEADRLAALHREIAPRLAPGDRLVYLGNLIGLGAQTAETLGEILTFRGRFLAGPRAFAGDIVYLRGSQEEMWHKLQQLQFASDPRGVLDWMLDHGIGKTLEAYGFSAREARSAAASGTVVLTRWTNQLRQAIKARPGHLPLMDELRRAAFTDDGALLFVHAGLDPARPLEAQKDAFWWSGPGFAQIVEPYAGYQRVVRGFAPQHPGIEQTTYSVTIDGGCGFEGPLLAACLLPNGEIVETLEA